MMPPFSTSSCCIQRGQERSVFRALSSYGQATWEETNFSSSRSVSSESHATRSLTFPLSRCLCVLTCNIALSTRMFCLANGRGSYSNNVTLIASVLVRAYYSTTLTGKKRLLFCDKRVMTPKRCSRCEIWLLFFSLIRVIDDCMTP